MENKPILKPATQDEAVLSEPADPLQSWVKRLSDQHMPIFDHTARNVTGIAGRQNSKAAHLASAILHDVAFTAKVLKMANSVYYNPGRKVVSTITRAVVVLGFETIRSICLTIAVIDAIKNGTQQQMVLSQLAHCFHAATQAKNIARAKNQKNTEEIYVATLLNQIGALGFWCHAQEEALELLNNPKPLEISVEHWQKNILGFSFNDLNLEVAKQWHLGDLLVRSLAPKPDLNDPSLKVIKAGHRIAELVKDGWDDYETKRELAQIARSLGFEMAEFRELLMEGALQAYDAVHMMGGAALGRFISLPAHLKNVPQVEKSDAPLKQKVYLQSDIKLQQRIMQEIDQLFAAKFDINMLLEMINEGLYRAVGLDRSFFALLTPDRRKLRAKHVLGWSQDGANLVIELPQNHGVKENQGGSHFFAEVLERGKPAFVKASDQQASGVLHVLSHKTAFFLAPVLSGDKVVGVFYADRQPSGRHMDPLSYEQFLRFVQRASEGFTLVGKKS